MSDLTESKSDEEIRQDCEKAMSYLQGFDDGRKCTIIEILAEIQSWENRVTGLGGNNRRAAQRIKSIIENIKDK